MENEMNPFSKEIMKSLAKIQLSINFIKEHIEDTTLTKEDLDSIEEAEKDLKEDKTISLESLKNEIGI